MLVEWSTPGGTSEIRKLLVSEYTAALEDDLPPGGNADLLWGGGSYEFGLLAKPIEITVDGAEEPQVRAPLSSFFGVMQDREPYFVDCAAFVVLPNPEASKKDALIPGTPGYNLFLPIPFSKSCRILVRGNEGAFLGTVVDWHRYEAHSPLTSYRLHAEHKRFATTPPRGGTIEMAKVTGNGFLAGFVTGYIQKNKSDMVFHTGGIKIHLDEETDPYTIEGNNVEDDYGFT